MDDVPPEKHKRWRISGCMGESRHMALCMSGRVQKIEAAVAVEVVCLESTDLEMLKSCYSREVDFA